MTHKTGHLSDGRIGRRIERERCEECDSLARVEIVIRNGFGELLCDRCAAEVVE